MEFTMEERCKKIITDCMNSNEKDPLKLFCELADKEYIRIHAPEHHILDGACLMTAFYNAGGKVDLEKGLYKLMEEGLKMPGATCGLWGVCGSVTSIGAALAIIEGTGPLSQDESFGLHMGFTSKVLARMSKTGGPRCCKRHAFISIAEGTGYLNERFSLDMPVCDVECRYSAENEQCIRGKCPFYIGE